MLCIAQVSTSCGLGCLAETVANFEMLHPQCEFQIFRPRWDSHKFGVLRSFTCFRCLDLQDLWCISVLATMVSGLMRNLWVLFLNVCHFEAVLFHSLRSNGGRRSLRQNFGSSCLCMVQSYFSYGFLKIQWTWKTWIIRKLWNQGCAALVPLLEAIPENTDPRKGFMEVEISKFSEKWKAWEIQWLNNPFLWRWGNHRETMGKWWFNDV